MKKKWLAVTLGVGVVFATTIGSSVMAGPAVGKDGEQVDIVKVSDDEIVKPAATPAAAAAGAAGGLAYGATKVVGERVAGWGMAKYDARWFNGRGSVDFPHHNSRGPGDFPIHPNHDYEQVKVVFDQ